ncbi:MAG: LuxR family transcriptional regulator, maltose regulon positive regulatory protein, partial [Solirubrobacteraceae bacterium]|nr:LuxR family transcriptional regulator, maltose regulon positive regulatory protein [Solirubrobacteraceae bacterium]
MYGRVVAMGAPSESERSAPSPGGPAPLLVTQFAVPAPPVGIVERPRLRALLSEGVQQPVTLVCGPAGSGKTALLCSELRNVAPGPLAWVSLGPGDDDQGRFWGAVLTALQGAASVPDESALRSLGPPVHDSRRLFMPLLANALTELREPLVLVLDDLQMVRSRECLAGLEFLLLHAPRTLRLVLSTRADPALSLHVLRLRGQLVEVRSADLAFTEEEAGELLATQGVRIAPELVAALCARTEGWGAGLRLAALSLRDREDPEQFVAEFAGDDRAVGDYLLAEVLDRQSPRLRKFLLRTAIVDRICGDLADALTETGSGAETLAALETTNGFVIGLDSRREWYRYHRLFARLLQTRAAREMAGELPGLHGRAARWYAAHGAESLALAHAVEAADWELATELAARHWFDLFVHGQGSTLRDLVDALPAEHLEGDAELAAALGCSALEAGDSDGAALHLAQAERAAAHVPAARRRAYLETMALARLLAARRDGDFGAALQAADTMLAEAAGHGAWSHDARRALVHSALGETAFWAHRHDRAQAELSEAIHLAGAIGLDYVRIAALSYLGLLDVLSDGAGSGSARAAEAVALAERRGWGTIPQTACAHVALGIIALCSDLRPDVATEHIERAFASVERVRRRQTHFILAHFAARLHAACGNARAGLDTLARFEVSKRAGVPSPFERAGVACMRARLLATLGDLDAASAALDEVRDEPWPVIRATDARLRLAAGDAASAVAILAELDEEPEAETHSVMALEMAVLLAVARDEAGEPADAARAVERALELAERTGYRWPFIEAGRRMERLLRTQIRFGTAHRAIVGELIAAFEDRLPVRHAVAPLLEPLSDREEAILRFLPTT